jgi:hypothetical protein
MAARCGAAAELSSAINTASANPREKTFTSLDYTEPKTLTMEEQCA